MINLLYMDYDSKPILEGIEHLELQTLYDMAFETYRVRNATSWYYKMYTSNPEAIRFRQDVIRDLYNNEGLFEELSRLYDCTENWRRKYEQSDSHVPSLRSSVESYGTVKEALCDLMRFHTVISKHIAEKKVTAEGLVSIADYVAETVEHHRFDALSRRFDEIFEVEPQYYTVGFNLDENLCPTHYKLMSALGKKARIGKKYSLSSGFWGGLADGLNMFSVVAKMSRSEQTTADNRGGDLANKPPLYRFAGEILHSCSSDSYSNMRDILRKLTIRIEDAVGFYVGAITLMRKLTKAGLPFCFPEIARDGEFTATELYLPQLMGRADSIIRNGVTLKDGQFAIITGANQGGKTTFLKSMGLAQLMFQLGFPVCAKSAKIGVCRNMLIIFSDRENHSSSLGRVGQELEKMADGLHKSADGNLFVLMNEPLTSTGEADSCLILKELFSIFNELNSRGCLVTHHHKLAKELTADTARFKSLVAKTENGGKNLTYCIIEGEPEGCSYAYNTVERKGIIFK